MRGIEDLHEMVPPKVPAHCVLTRTRLWGTSLVSPALCLRVSETDVTVTVEFSVLTGCI